MFIIKALIQTGLIIYVLSIRIQKNLCSEPEKTCFSKINFFYQQIFFFLFLVNSTMSIQLIRRAVPEADEAIVEYIEGYLRENDFEEDEDAIVHFVKPILGRRWRRSQD
ncbi:unnamed protein product [Rhizopus stolonifer]